MLVLGIILLVGLLALGFYSRRVYRAKPWLPNYVKWKVAKTFSSDNVAWPRHIMFLFVDHFEPWEDTDDPEVAKSRMRSWVKNYPAMASKHRDADGVAPQHTWFYLVEDWRWKKYDANFVRQLAELSYNGFGEVELHVHHGAPQRIFPDVDSAEKLESLIEEMKDFYAQSGALITAEEAPKQLYGFIHGKWALDNAMTGLYCGVDNELEVLHKTGCYADFTMPSGIESQSRKINSIYYPTGNPLNPKSYDFGIDVRVGERNNGRLLMFAGMIDIYFRNIFLGGSIVEKSNLDHNDIPTRLRMDTWVKSNIHVKNRPQWIFVKVHTHGAREEDFDVCLGDLACKMHNYLGAYYNDGERFKLHYVTAREAYNIVKAAEAGESDDPSQFRDYLIKPYANKKIKSTVPYELLVYKKDKIKLNLLDNSNRAKLNFKDAMLKEVAGDSVEFLEYSSSKESRSLVVNLKGNGRVNFEVMIPGPRDGELKKIENASVVKTQDSSNGKLYQLETKLEAYEEKIVSIRY